MAFQLAYLMLARVLSWLALLARSDGAKDLGATLIAGIRPGPWREGR